MKNKNRSANGNANIPNNKNQIIKERFEYNERQLEIIHAGLNKETKSIFIDGIWGSSKSYLSVLISLKLLYQNKINQIIYVRNPVESSTTSKTGFLPGDIAEKMAPYNQIFFDKLGELLPKSEVEKLIKENKLACIPLGFARGLSILLLSRCGEHTKIFFVGDSLNQNDIGNKSGFRQMFDLLSDEESKENGVFTFERQKMEDIVRSGFVRFIMKKTGKIKN